MMPDSKKNQSNIGVRRQSPNSRGIPAAGNAGKTAKIGSHGNKNARLQSSSCGQDEPKRASQSRLQDLKRRELVNTRYGSRQGQHTSWADGDDDTEDDEVSHRLGHSYGYAERADTDSSSGSPPMLINPDFDLLPVAKTEHAKGAFDYHVSSYVTSIIEVSPEDITPYSSMIHQILYDELLFTAFTTTSEAARWRTLTLYDDPPASVVKGYGRTLALLARKLQNERFAMSPTVLLAMGQLVAIETMIKNVSATARHLAGMQAAMRPKTDGTPVQNRSTVQGAVDIWRQYFMYRHMIKSKVSRMGKLTYPKTPFDPRLVEKIANLPEGFAEIALSGRVSIEMIELLDHFRQYFASILEHNAQDNPDPEEHTANVLSQVAMCVEYHQIQTLTTIERVILLALTAYAVRKDRIFPGFVNVRNYFQITCAYQINLMAVPETGLPQEDHGSDMVQWAGLMLLLTSSPEAHGRKLALKLLPKRPEPMKILQKCQEFFWDDDLTNALLNGNVLTTKTSNDILADNVKQALSDAEKQDSTEAED